MDDALQAELPTPDELLLELMDLVQLAFPAAIDALTVTFVPNEDGKRPALSNIDATGPVGAPQRPALGHEDGMVLDAVNGLLAELADATERAGGMRAHAGTVTVTTGTDGERTVVLVADNGDRMERRFDASELRWLLYTGPLFEALNGTEAQERALIDSTTQALLGTRRFDIDMTTGTITFSAGATGAAVAPRTFAFELLGSHVTESSRWLWGWDNDATPPKLTRRVDALRAGATGAGLRMLSEGVFSCPPACAERLGRHAAVRIGARGIYQAPFVGKDGNGDKTTGFMMLGLFDP